MDQALAPLREEQPEAYQSFRCAMDSLGAIQLNPVGAAGAQFFQPSGLDEEQALFLRHLNVRSLLPRQVAGNHRR